MRRTAIALLTAALLAAPGVAYASIDHCPQAVKDVRGVQPSSAAIGAELDAAAVTHDVPKQVLRAIAYVESDWRQFKADGSVIASTDSVCGLGIMQVTADTYSEADQVRLAEDYEYNIDQGAAILAQKWAVSQQTPPPTGAAPDDKNVLENWFYAIYLYNGDSGGSTYPTKVANVIADPFRYAPNFGALDPYYFTKPQDVNPSYVFPSAFQARTSPEEFVFYDHTTGTPTSTVSAPTTLRSEPAAITTGYGSATLGPDMSGVTCTQCGGWRLAAGAGMKGRAHWTNSVTGPEQSTMIWSPGLAYTGPYRVRAYVPAIGADTLGTATYDVGGTDVTIDQNAAKNAWRDLGRHTLSPGDKVVLSDHSSVGGQKLAGDAMRITAIPTLHNTPAATTVTYGTGTTLSTRLTFADVAFSHDDWRVQLYKRPVGASAWTYSGRFPVDASSDNLIPVKPAVSTEYQLRWTSADPYYESVRSSVRRVYVRHRVGATIAEEVVSRGDSASITAVVAPSHAGRTVVLQRKVNGVWQQALTKTLGSTSRATFTVAKAPGTYYYRAYMPADASHVAGYSAQVRLIVIG